MFEAKLLKSENDRDGQLRSNDLHLDPLRERMAGQEPTLYLLRRAR
jgi:hypothetical protein